MDNLVQIFENVKILTPRPNYGPRNYSKGYKPAETSGDKYHGVSKFDVITGEQNKSISNKPSYTKVFAETLIKHAEKTQSNWYYWSNAIRHWTNLFEKFPDRMFDVGIAEQHAVTFAAGLTTEGY